jgi:hypothetical protein
MVAISTSTSSSSMSSRICGRLRDCCSCRLLVLLLVLLLLVLYNCMKPPSNNPLLLLSYNNRLGSKSGSVSLPVPVVSLVVLKLPRSGSTWLAESLNRLPSVFISKEILQQGDTTTILPLTSPSSASKDTTYASSVLSHLASALDKPMGKFAKRNNFLPDGYMHTYLHLFYIHT